MGYILFHTTFFGYWRKKDMTGRKFLFRNIFAGNRLRLELFIKKCYGDTLNLHTHTLLY